MTAFFYWSGVVAWLVLGLYGALVLGDQLIDWTIQSFWTKREFLAFVASRLRRA